jgi:hypothetical protein
MMPSVVTAARRFKTIHQNTVLGEQGVALIAKRVWEMGCIWYATGGVEAGIDGTIELRDSETGEAFNCIIRVQSKATAGSFQGETATALHYLCDERDLDYWLRGNAPVILVVSRPSTGEAYWVSVKDYFGDPTARRSRRVTFDKQRDRFDVTCRSSLARLALPRDAGIYFTPLQKREVLYSNLLPVTYVAEDLYIAETSFRFADRLWGDLRRYDSNAGGEWLLKNQRLFSFHDLTEYPWNQLCETGTVERFQSDEWAFSDEPDRQRDFVRLLNEALRTKTRPDLENSRKKACLYFAPTKDRTTRHFAYQGPSGTRTSRAVFQSYQAKAIRDHIYYYRHSAFQHRFRRFGNTWYLEITPTYHFTNDGYHLHRDYEGLLSGIKRIEHNPAVLGQVVMWADYLGRRGDLFTQEYPFLRFAPLTTFDLEGGIDEEAWLQHEEGERTIGDQEAADMLSLFQP